jgi:hypothetical protein
MAIDFTTYAGWIEGLKQWIDVEDLSDDIFAVCLQLAQVRLNRELNSQWMESNHPITVITPSIPLSLTTAIPDYNRVRLVVSSQNLLPLEARAFNEYQKSIADLYGDGQAISPQSEKPCEYAIESQSLYIAPYPAAASIITVYYYVLVPPISVSLNNNIFTDHHFDVLLYASCLEISRYIVEDERVPLWEQAFQDAIASVNGVAVKSKMGSTPLRRVVGAY